jgi:hypothetical protein
MDRGSKTRLMLLAPLRDEPNDQSAWTELLTRENGLALRPTKRQTP